MRDCLVLKGVVALICLLAAAGCEGTGEHGPLLKSGTGSAPLVPQKKVLVLHSYHPEFAWVGDVNRGILKGLAEERFLPDRNLTVEYFYMDTKRKTDAEWKKTVSAEAVEKIKRWEPDVVIAADDNAQKYVVAPLKDSGTAFAFLGVNEDPLSYGYIDSWKRPGHRVGGCVERERLDGSLALLRRLAPKVRRLAVLCDDGPTGRPIVDRIRVLAPTLDAQVVAVKQTGSFSEWKGFVETVQGTADALVVVLYHTLRDDLGRHVDENGVLSWTVANSKLPDVGFWSWAVEGGLLCSEAISGYQQGHYAGTVASYVLMGQSPGEFSVDRPRRGELCVNTARARSLGIEVPYELLASASTFDEIGSAKR